MDARSIRLRRQSPANVRDIVSETYTWLDKYLGVNASEKGEVEAMATLQK